MGLLHGAFCVGRCWFVMGLMFFGGVMNLDWIAGLALLVLFEKTVAAGHWLGGRLETYEVKRTRYPAWMSSLYSSL